MSPSGTAAASCACSCVGRLDRAGQLLGRYAHGIDSQDALAAAAALSLSRAVVAVGHGDLDGAAEMFAEAASAWAALPRRYDEMLALERQGRCRLSGDAAFRPSRPERVGDRR